MRSTARITNPDVIIVEVTMTLDLFGWKKLRDQLSLAWPSSDLSSEIGSMIRQIEQQVHTDTDGKSVQ